MQAAAGALAERRSRRARADLSGADLTSGDKMVCGGAAEVLITYVAPGDAELLAVCSALRAARDAGRRAWYVAAPLGDDAAAVEHCALDEDGAVTGAAVCDAAALRGLTAVAALHGVATLPDGRTAVLERVEPPALAVVCGAGHVGTRGRAAARASGLPRGRRRRPRGVRGGRAVPRRARRHPAVRGRARGRRRGRARLRGHRHSRARARPRRAASRRCASAPATSASWPAAPSGRACRRRCARRASTSEAIAARPLADRPRDRRGDAGRARREHRRRDRPGARRRRRLSRGAPRRHRPRGRALVAHGRAQAARRRRRTHAARARRRRLHAGRRGRRRRGGGSPARRGRGRRHRRRRQGGHESRLRPGDVLFPARGRAGPGPRRHAVLRAAGRRSAGPAGDHRPSRSGRAGSLAAGRRRSSIRSGTESRGIRRSSAARCAPRSAPPIRPRGCASCCSRTPPLPPWSRWTTRRAARRRHAGGPRPHPRAGRGGGRPRRARLPAAARRPEGAPRPRRPLARRDGGGHGAHHRPQRAPPAPGALRS